MFFGMYAQGSLVILLLVTYILTDEPSNQKRVSSMYVQESLFILLLGTYIHTDQPKMSALIRVKTNTPPQKFCFPHVCIHVIFISLVKNRMCMKCLIDFVELID